MKQCPKCHGPVSADAKFCRYCAFDFSHSGQFSVSVATETAPQSSVCPSCGAIVNGSAGFCNNCAAPLSHERRKNVAASPAVIIGVILVIVVAVLLYSRRPSSISSSGSSSSSSSGSSSSSILSDSKRTTSDGSKLTTDKVQRAVDKALDWTRKGGRANVLGIQETPDNSAKADIQYAGFQYNADSVGSPVSKDKKAPPEPSINDPDFYNKMAQYGLGQTQVKTYSGRGVAILKHYNDGRWVLTEVQFDFVGVTSTIEVQ
jgi:predicted nucleic acid-binding Zn ribbon protein